jgi:8-oxo-dGTP pyrophosphatase MutT (NUDIX family)
MTRNEPGKDPHKVSILERTTEALQRLRPVRLEPRERHAAVALMLRERSGGLELFVIKRAEKVEDPWSGHMALPGGAREKGDRDAYDTARRETLEEVGIDLAEGRFLGRHRCAAKVAPIPGGRGGLLGSAGPPRRRARRDSRLPRLLARLHLQRPLRHLGSHPPHPVAAVGLDPRVMQNPAGGFHPLAFGNRDAPRFASFGRSGVAGENAQRRSPIPSPPFLKSSQTLFIPSRTLIDAPGARACSARYRGGQW